MYVCKCCSEHEGRACTAGGHGRMHEPNDVGKTEWGVVSGEREGNCSGTGCARECRRPPGVCPRGQAAPSSSTLPPCKSRPKLNGLLLRHGKGVLHELLTPPPSAHVAPLVGLKMLGRSTHDLQRKRRCRGEGRGSNAGSMGAVRLRAVPGAGMAPSVLGTHKHTYTHIHTHVHTYTHIHTHTHATRRGTGSPRPLASPSTPLPPSLPPHLHTHTCAATPLNTPGITGGRPSTKPPPLEAPNANSGAASRRSRASSAFRAVST